jgi:hypothetical protein
MKMRDKQSRKKEGSMKKKSRAYFLPTVALTATLCLTWLAPSVKGGRLQSTLDYLHKYESFPKLLVPDGFDDKIDVEIDKLMVDLFGTKHPLKQIYYDDDEDGSNTNTDSSNTDDSGQTIW